MTHVLDVDCLEELVERLRAGGRDVVAPVVRDGVIAVEPIEHVEQLPRGWSDRQEAGTYRLQRTGGPELFGFAAPSIPWKRWLYPERTLMVRSRPSADGGLEITAPEQQEQRLAFFGIRSCDVAAIGLLDRVFTEPGRTDPAYAARREGLVVVAVGCSSPSGTCFCASMGTGPSPETGFDVRLVELTDGGRHRFLADAGTERGAALLRGLGTDGASAADHAAADRQRRESVARMGRELRLDDPSVLSRDPEHPRWEDVASRCLSCANCTMACPTCFCSTVEDTSDLTTAENERWRRWDSCFSVDFSYVHPEPVRDTTRSRYRHWLLHKLVTWHDQFGSSGCVGCGRCITWCPVGIDITEEARALAAEARGRPPEASR